MLRATLAASLALVACGRSQGVPDRDLGGLVVAPPRQAAPIDLSRAAADPAELGRALATPEHAVAAALGPHEETITTSMQVREADRVQSDLDDRTVIDLGADRAFHAVYTNSADYGREVIFTGDKLYLRPRYQRWHERAPETPDEPEQLRDEMYGAGAAIWDLVEPGAELTDLGAVKLVGRDGRKIAIKLAPQGKTPPREALAQRKWRETRTVDALSGEIVLDADKGVPLSIKLDATIGFVRDNRHFTMKLSLASAVSRIGELAQIAAPAGDDVVATPERLREVDDRDYLLQGIAPPLRKNPDGTPLVPVAPPPAGPAGSGSPR